MDYRVALASSGSPEVAGRPEWPVYTSSRSLVMELGEMIAAGESRDADLCGDLGPGRNAR